MTILIRTNYISDSLLASPAVPIRDSHIRIPCPLPVIPLVPYLSPLPVGSTFPSLLVSSLSIRDLSLGFRVSARRPIHLRIRANPSSIPRFSSGIPRAADSSFDSDDSQIPSEPIVSQTN